MGVNKIFNLHFTDFCNYKCRFCFVKNARHTLSLEQVKIAVTKIADYFAKNKINDGRINIAGGEPMTCKNLQEIIDFIMEHGIKVSLITNGSLLTKEFISANKGKLSMIGLSIDSINPKTNIALGRCQGSQVFGYEKLLKICKCIKENGIVLKINVVVSKLNRGENLIPLLKDVSPERFKILQMLPTTDFAKSNIISDEEFHLYLKQYEDYNYVSEKRENISKAYMIIDSQGFLTTNNQHCDKQFNIFEDDLETAINEIDFDYESEALRYK